MSSCVQCLNPQPLSPIAFQHAHRRLIPVQFRMQFRTTSASASRAVFVTSCNLSEVGCWLTLLSLSLSLCNRNPLLERALIHTYVRYTNSSREESGPHAKSFKFFLNSPIAHSFLADGPQSGARPEIDFPYIYCPFKPQW
jgi:hypothetical protein